jgi:hypothetical protein
MKRYFLLLHIQFVVKFWSPLYVIVSLSVLTSLSPTESVSDQLEDFRVFRSVLESKEGTLDMHLSSDSISFYLGQLETALQKDQSILEQFKLYSEMIARLNCGHTQVLNNRKIQAEWLLEKNDLPIDMYLIGRRLVVGKIIPEDYENTIRDNRPEGGPSSIPVGSEILSIDSLSVPEMMAGIGRYLSGDEGSVGFKYYQAQELFAFYRHLAFPFRADSISVQYVTPQNDTLHTFLQPGKAPLHSMNERIMSAALKYNENEVDMGKFKIVNGKYGYFRFTSFSASTGVEYDAFLRKAFRKMNRNNIDKLVVDLRGNTGGIMQYDFIKYFVGGNRDIGRYVIAKPFRKLENKYIKKMNLSFVRYAFLSWSQKRQLKNGNFDGGRIITDPIDEDVKFKGEVVVITDEGTFSSAAILACHLKTLADATIIGRPAGGSFYAGNAGTLLVKLPNSGLLISVNPNTFYSHLTPTNDPLEIREPDVYLDPMILDEKDRNQFYFRNAVATFKD